MKKDKTFFLGILLFGISIFYACNHHLTNSNSLSSNWLLFLGEDEDYLTEGANYITSVRGGTYIYRRFFPEIRVLTHYIEFSDSRFEVRDGIYKEYTDQGILLKEGQYNSNEKTGHWIWYEPWTGKLQYSGTFISNKEIGIWYEYFLDNGLVKEERIYPTTGSNDTMVSFIRYDSTSTAIVKEGIMYMDTIFSISYSDTSYLNNMKEPESGTYTIAEKMPLFMCIENEDSAETALLKHIYSKIKYPEEARTDDIAGKAIISFTIDTTGQVIDIKSYRGVCQSIKDECFRIVNEMPDWCPAEHNSGKVKVQYNLPVRFELE